MRLFVGQRVWVVQRICASAEDGVPAPARRGLLDRFDFKALLSKRAGTA